MSDPSRFRETQVELTHPKRTRPLSIQKYITPPPPNGFSRFRVVLFEIWLLRDDPHVEPAYHTFSFALQQRAREREGRSLEYVLPVIGWLAVALGIIFLGAPDVLVALRVTHLPNITGFFEPCALQRSNKVSEEASKVMAVDERLQMKPRNNGVEGTAFFIAQ